MYDFLYRLLIDFYPKTKGLINLIQVSSRLDRSAFSFTLKDLSAFSSLSQQFYLFGVLPPLNITFIVKNCNSGPQIRDFLKFFKIPVF